MLGVLAADEINVIAVGRKGEAAIARGGRRDDLRVAASGNVAEPEGLQASFVQYVEQIFSIRGNSGQSDVTVVGKIFDRHSFDGQILLAGQEGVDTEGGGDEQEENSSKHEARAELVLAGGGDQDGTARWRTWGLRRCSGWPRSKLRSDDAWRRRRNGSYFAGIALTLQAFQVSAEFRGDLVANVAILFKGLVEDALELGRDVGIEGDGSHGSVVQDVVEDDGAGSARKRLLACSHLVEHAAEGEEVASSIKFLAARLLG